MAGSRIHKYKTILVRVEGLIKSQVMETKDRPIWYEVMKRFPPKVEPQFDREEPKVEVKNILYPEDLIRAKYFDEFVDRDVFNIKNTKRKTKVQEFVNCYKELHKPGMSPDEIVEAVEKELNEKGGKYTRKTKQVFVEPQPVLDDIHIESPKEKASRKAWSKLDV